MKTRVEAGALRSRCVGSAHARLVCALGLFSLSACGYVLDGKVTNADAAADAGADAPRLDATLDDVRSPGVDAGPDARFPSDTFDGGLDFLDGGPSGELLTMYSVPITSTGTVVVNAVDVNSAGHAIVVGLSTGNVTIAGETYTGASSGTNAFVTSIDAAGARWFQTWGQDGLVNELQDVAVGRDEFIYVTGVAMGNPTIGDIPISAPGNQKALLASFDSDGNSVHAEVFGSDAQGRVVAASPSGDVAIGGVYGTTANLGGVDLPAPSLGDEYGFVAGFKANAKGFFLFTWQHAITSDGLGASLAMDFRGDNILYVGGRFEDGDIGYGGIATRGVDAFVTRYDSVNGDLGFGRSFGSVGFDDVRKVETRGSDDYFVAGESTTGVEFGDGPRTGFGGSDAYVARYDRDGTLRYAQLIGGPNADRAWALATDEMDRVYVGGEVDSELTVAGTTLRTATSPGFIVRLDALGEAPVIVRTGGSGSALIRGLTHDGSRDRLIAVGTASGNVRFGEDEIFDYPTSSSFVWVLDAPD